MSYHPIRLIVSKSGDIVNMYIYVVYSGKNWIFMDKFKVRIDGKFYEYTPTEVRRSVNLGFCVEKITELVTPALLEIVYNIIYSDNAMIRLEGEKVQNIELTDIDRKALKETWFVYYYLSGVVFNKNAYTPE